MARKSSIDGIPKKAKTRLLSMVEEGATLDMIVLEMEQKYGLSLSRSAVGRKAKNLHATAKKIKEAKEIAEAWAGKLGDVPDNKQGQLLIEMLHTIIFKVLSVYSEADAETLLNSMDFMMLARSIKDLASAQTITADREIKLRKEITEKAASVAGDVLKKQKGITRETIDQVKRNILGIREEG